MTATEQFDHAAMARAVVMLSRYSVEITRTARSALGRDGGENREIQVLLAVHGAGSITPSALAELTGAVPSVISRTLRRLQGAGLIERTPDPDDRRSVLVTVSGKGRRRISAFAAELSDSFVASQPLFKDTLHELGFPAPAMVGRPHDPLAVGAAMARAGAAYVADLAVALEPFGVREFPERFALSLIYLNGKQRPTQIADELGFTLSGTSGVLARLDTAGLITRRHDATPGDRRVVALELTPRGTAAVQTQLAVFSRHAGAFAEALALACGG